MAIEVTQEDVGRRVRYCNRRCTLEGVTEECEYGVIISFGIRMVFVRYDGDFNSKGTLASDLEYVE